MDACPPLEDIAAFLDDTLSPEERERIAEHLARCESCYAVFAGAAHFELEEGSSAGDAGGRGVLPFPLDGREGQVETEPAPSTSVVLQRPPSRRRAPRWLPLAASIVLAAGLGYFAWQSFTVPQEMELADLTRPLQRKPGLTNFLYDSQTYRGLDDSGDFPPEDAKAFLASVYLVDLHLTVGTENPERSADALRRIGTEIEQIPLFGDEGKKYQDQAQNLTSPEALRRFSQRLSEEEKNIQDLLSLYEPFYSFGLWSEAGRLAAVTRTRDFFERRDNRRFLSHLQKTLPDQLAPDLQQPVMEDLQAIEHTWDKGALSPEDYDVLEKRFQNIIQRIDEYEEDLTGDV